jgi:hypothetical protein
MAEEIPMATPGQLVQVLAEVLGISAATVAQYDRRLAEGGLRSKAGRGTSAAKITPQDAANLLIAVAASPLSGQSVKGAVDTCEAYGSLPAVTSWATNFPKFGLPALTRLPPGHTLREALIALIDGTRNGQFFKIRIPREKPFTGADSFFEVTFEGPRPWAEILADGSIGTANRSKMARLVYVSEKTASTKERDREGDLHQVRRITFATIRSLGSLISEGGH